MFSYYRINQACHDRAAQFVMLCARNGSNYLEAEDFNPLLQVTKKLQHFFDYKTGFFPFKTVKEI